MRLPVTEKHILDGSRSDGAFAFGVAEMQGWRTSHEDAHEMKCDGDSGAFWVLDGHGGDGAALYGAPELAQEFEKDMCTGDLPPDERLVKGFEDVDTRLRNYIQENPDKDSGSTVVGALVMRQSDGTYSMKLCNCGDSRGIVVRPPTEEEGSAPAVKVGIPEHIAVLADDADAVANRIVATAALAAEEHSKPEKEEEEKIYAAKDVTEKKQKTKQAEQKQNKTKQNNCSNHYHFLTAWLYTHP